MREQFTRVKTGAVRKRVAAFTAGSIALLLIAAVIYILIYKPPYQPPPLESNAVAGVPAAPDNARYGTIDAAGKFKVGVAGVMHRQEDGSLNLYFANSEENNAYLMCEIVDTDSKEPLYRSGLLRPGEYVESLQPLRKITNEAVKVEIYVYALGLDDYISAGEITLENTLQPYGSADNYNNYNN